MATALLRT